MRTKIIIGAVIGIIILAAAIIFIVINKKSGTEDKYIGFWKDDKYTYKLTKGNDEYYEIFIVGDNSTEADSFGKYDKDKKVLIVHSSTSAGKKRGKEELFSNSAPDKYPTMYECWVYNEKKDQIDVYYKSDYDKGNLDLQEKRDILTRVDDK